MTSETKNMVKDLLCPTGEREDMESESGVDNS